jgi:hypothetical protein
MAKCLQRMPQLDLLQGRLHPSEHPLSEDAKSGEKLDQTLKLNCLGSFCGVRPKGRHDCNLGEGFSVGRGIGKSSSR